MKEKNIRPCYLMKENAKLHAQDIQEFLNRKNEFIKIPCPACESTNYQFIFKKDGFSFVKCQECETVYINPRPTGEMLEEFYTTSRSIKHWNDKIFPMSEDFRRVKIFIPRAKKVLELCKKYSVSTKVLLDIGAGFGTFCEEIKRLGLFKKVIAVEPSHALSQTCQAKGLDVIEKSIEKVEKLSEELNVITSFELIEHLYWPKDFLFTCAKMLSKNGILILTTPNIKGFDLFILGKLSSNIGGPNHLNYFHPQSLEYLLNQCDLKVIDMETPGELDAELVRKKILEGKIDILGYPFLKHILIDQWANLGDSFQEFLASNMLSSHLWVVAQKR